jgi:hypothetical protein
VSRDDGGAGSGQRAGEFLRILRPAGVVSRAFPDRRIDSSSGDFSARSDGAGKARGVVQAKAMTPQMRRVAAAAAAFVTLEVAGCTPANSPLGVVDRFIEAHYLAIDLKAAEPLCTGLALEKLHKEIALTEGQQIDASTRKPVIHYKLTAERDGEDHVTFLFLATIDVEDGGSFKKNWMITARKQGADWRVSNFSEYD